MSPRRTPLFPFALLLGLLGTTAFGQGGSDGGTPLAMEDVPEEHRLSEEELTEDVMVTATRRPETIATIPGSVTTVAEEQVETLYGASGNNLGDALGKVVPGLSLGNHSTSTFGQTLRGRGVLVLIDGVPQNASRNVAHDLHAIAPDMIERVEVVRGTTAIYGEGASGGIINIITKAAGRRGLKFSTTLETSTAVVRPVEGFGGRMAQTVEGGSGDLGYTLGASLERAGGYFDAAGDRIPPNPYGQGGLADTYQWDVFGKLAYRLTPDQRLRLMVNHFQGQQATEYASDPAVNAVPPLGVKARTLPGLELRQPEGTRNTNVSLIYDHDALLGSTVRAHAFYRNFTTNFFPFDGRALANYQAITQSRLDTQKGGARLEIGTPLPFDLNVLWGVDAAQEHTAQPVTLIDPVEYDRSGALSFQPIGERDWVPPMDIGTLAGFAQLEWTATRWMTVRAGVRQEFIRLGVDDYETLIGNAIQGARLNYASTVFNAGVIVAPIEAVQTYANFSQGYALPDVGILLRNAPAGATVATLNTAPQKVDLVEVGSRFDFGVAGGSLALFYNQSALGTSSGGLSQPVVRAPERIYGLEATANVRPIETLQVDATFTWLEGQLDRADNGTWTFLNGYRIPPPQWTLSASHQTLPGWHNGVVVTISGSRRRFPGSVAFGERDVAAYATVDLSSRLDVGPGTLGLSVTNLLNQQYFPRVSQMLYSGRNDSYSAARGAVATLRYTLEY